MANVSKLKKHIKKYLDANDWKYAWEEEYNRFRMGMTLDCKLKSCTLYVCLKEDFFTVYGTINIGADKDCRTQIMEAITRINYGLRWGNFELDLSDGEIRYKVLVDCGDDNDCMPSPSVIKRALLFPAQSIQKYGDALLAVMYGLKSAEQAVKDAESN
ncbi:MAG: YbjN domain-containing protein [Clostridia bacterium]|nr:YbjN domain-containing protein [Clostridia bacterium]